MKLVHFFSKVFILLEMRDKEKDMVNEGVLIDEFYCEEWESEVYFVATWKSGFLLFLWNLYQGRCVYFYVVAWKIGRWCLWLIFISCMEWFFMVLLFGSGMCRKCHWRENEEKWCSEIVLEEEWKLCDFGSVYGWVGEEHNWEKRRGE